MVGESPEEAEALLEAVRDSTDKPLIVKLTPNADPVPVAQAAERGGADALSAINTLRAAPRSPGTGGPWLGGGSGGLSGRAVREVALAQVGAICEAVSVPVVGMGGISSGRDALEMLAAGARIVAVGTESFRDPAAGERIAAELEGEIGSADSASANLFSEIR